MDMQNVSNLQIPEGAVRTIHDKDGKLLWGRLAYDTKYAGDTLQQTYSGKNLFGIGSLRSTTNGSSSISNGVITLIPTGTGNSIVRLNLIKPLPAGTYTLNSSTYLSASTQLRNSTDSTTIYNFSSNYQNVTFTTTDEAPMIRFNFANPGNTNPIYIDLNTLQIEAGSTPTSYEPYVGGIPAPNPDYPQTVNVVTGTQTITLTDGVVSQDYTVDLGSTELCKIGDYQDYIYKSADDWYVHKTTNKVVLDGTEPSWSRLVISGITRYFTVDVADALIITNTSVVSPIISNYFTSQTPSDVYTTAVPYGISLNSGTAKFRIRNEDFSEIADFTNWLSTHNTIVYYALATPTDTQITDATLIGQLDAIHQFLTRYGYSATVTGNLPIVISKTDLS